MTEKDIYRQIIQGNMQEDIMVMEDHKHMPLLGEEFLIQYLYIGLCISGYAKGQYDYKDFCFKAGDMCWLLPNHVMRYDEASEDYAVLSVFINKAYYQKLDSKGLLPRHYYPFFITTISLDQQQSELILNGFQMIGKMASIDHPQRDELICKMCDVIATLCDEFIVQKTPSVSDMQKHYFQLFEHFYTDLLQHYRESREVSFYAHRQSLTPKYFATVIKQTTGKSASQWINNYVIVQAKWILQHGHDKTVQQIANQLGFSEQASFSRFFKSNTGVTPTAYREKI